MGCFRHLDEIIGWTQFPEDEKKAILELAEQRKGNYKHLLKFY
jgi:predicted Fe-S protein YdhL (DUF1289 family)